jgi:hypothetical protein
VARTVGDDTPETAAVAGYELVEVVDERCCPERSQQASQRSREPKLCEESNAASGVAGDRRAVAEHEPRALPPRRLGYVSQQPRGLVVGEREQGVLPPPVESRDDTRREPAELSSARVEKNRTRKARVSRHRPAYVRTAISGRFGARVLSSPPLISMRTSMTITASTGIRMGWLTVPSCARARASRPFRSASESWRPLRLCRRGSSS